MKQLTPEQIVNNWNELIQLIEGEFDGERKEKLLEMYKYFEDRMSIHQLVVKNITIIICRWLC